MTTIALLMVLLNIPQAKVAAAYNSQSTLCKDSLINGRDKITIACTVRHGAVLTWVLVYSIVCYYSNSSVLIHMIICLFFQCQYTLQYSSIRTGMYLEEKDVFGAT